MAGLTKNEVKLTMAKKTAPVEIALLIYPGSQLAAVHGLTDLFQIAERLFQRSKGIEHPVLRVSHVQFDAGSSSPPRADSAPDFVIVPPSLGGLPIGDAFAPIVQWLKDCHARGAVLASVCVGTFLLAQTGLLAKRAATTHWSQAQHLAERFPEIRVDADKLLIDDGDILTAGGLMAWPDLGLRIVDRLLGSAAIVETARFLLVDPPGREQRYYSAFSPKLNHGDKTILEVQHWLQQDSAHHPTIASMAQRAGLEERTFLRRFQKATGLRPTEYCQHLRVGKAREMLETSQQSFDQVAWKVGYEDVGSFRKVFIKLTGLSPGDYRRRFRVQSQGQGTSPTLQAEEV
ncbi:transcriptional regulator GlxA family with amidase domain [Caballeronia udeis]|uniref:Transcriptional regulator GlxA family with amidase domain n=1 Tax=Caballeronia udeis TaxID=1232866 RepID=A0ABW8MJ22_9BURK